MFPALLLPLIWGLGGVIAVALLTHQGARSIERAPRIEVTRTDDVRPAA